MLSDLDPVTQPDLYQDTRLDLDRILYRTQPNLDQDTQPDLEPETRPDLYPETQPDLVWSVRNVSGRLNTWTGLACHCPKSE
jgi:hypothetical protein